MKIKHTVVMTIITAAIAAFVGIGCDTPPDNLFQEQIERADVVNTQQVVTQVPETTDGTNVIPAHSLTNTVITTNTVLTTNWIPRAEVLATVKGVGALLPQPWGNVGAGLVGTLLTIWGSLATRRKNRLAQIAGVLIDNVEAGRHLLRQAGGQKIDEQFIEGIVESQTYSGVRADIDRLRRDR